MPRADAAPESIGPYHLLQVLGEGGMGIVYLAEQREPIHRRVALKLIKPGMDTREVLARFEAERQTLALMDHPNIARVIEAGATPDHRPYFVMEYAPGVPVTEYCDQHHYGARARLDLFIQICAAVQHGHQKGIIHRDLKPSNVLVTEVDARPTPKVIDFGIAKATEQRQAEQTMFTQQGMLIGTPEYMSPEQADPGVVDIDTRTDIDSLGVILYELLTGVLPFDAATLRKARLFEMHRLIREQEPAWPSTRLTTATAGGQRSSPQMQSSELRGDLDWITLKALEKDRNRRYGSASELAADIERHLRSEPVLAGPATAWYRTQKFVRKHRGGVAAAAALIVCVLAGLATSTALYVRAERQRAEADLQRGRAEQQRHEADVQRTRAETEGTEAVRQRGQAEQRRVEADTARQATAAAYDRERVARTRADTARQESDRQRQEAEWQAYASTISGVDLNLRAGEIAEALTRLNEVRADMRGWEWRHLSYRADSSLKTLELRGESPMLNVHFSSFSFSGDGTRVFWNTQTTLHSWDARTNAAVEMLGDVGWILAVAPGGTTLATQSLAPWEQPGGRGTAPVPAGGQPSTVDEAHHVLNVVDGSTGRTLRTLTGHRAPVWCGAFSPDGSLLASRSQDGAVWIWDVTSGRTVALLTTEGAEPYCALAFNRDGTRLVSSAATGKVQVWDVSNKSPVATLLGQSGAVRAIAFSHDGKSVATGSLDRTVRIWDVTTGAMRQVFTGHGGEVASVAFSPDDRPLASDGYDRTVRVWNVESGDQEAALSGHPKAEVNSVAFDPTGERLLAGSTTFDAGRVRIWNAAGNGAGVTLSHDRILTCIAFGPDGTRVAAGSEDGSIQIWDPHTSTRLLALKGHEGPVRTVAFDPRGDRLVSGSADKSVRVWDLASGKMLTTLTGHRERINSVAVSPRGTEIASASNDRTIRVWNAASGALLATWEGTELVNAVVFTQQGDAILFVAGDDRRETDSLGQRHVKTAGVWNWRSKTEPRLVDALASQAVGAIAVSADGGKMLLAGRAVTEPVLWDGLFTTRIRKFQLRLLGSFEVFDIPRGLSGDSMLSQGLAFSADGTRIASISARTARIWDAESGRLLLTLQHNTDLQGVSFSPDGSQLAVLQDHAIRLWRAVPPSKGAITRPPPR